MPPPTTPTVGVRRSSLCFWHFWRLCSLIALLPVRGGAPPPPRVTDHAPTVVGPRQQRPHHPAPSPVGHVGASARQKRAPRRGQSNMDVPGIPAYGEPRLRFSTGRSGRAESTPGSCHSGASDRDGDQRLGSQAGPGADAGAGPRARLGCRGAGRRRDQKPRCGKNQECFPHDPTSPLRTVAGVHHMPGCQERPCLTDHAEALASAGGCPQVPDPATDRNRNGAVAGADHSWRVIGDAGWRRCPSTGQEAGR